MEEVTEGVALAFLRRHPHVYLLARRSDGYPTGYPMMAQLGGGSVRFSTYRASAKVRFLLRDGVAGILALDPESGTSLYAEGPVTVARELQAPSTPSGSDPGAAPPPPVPPDIVEKVGRRHREGKRVTLQIAVRSACLGPGPD